MANENTGVETYGQEKAWMPQKKQGDNVDKTYWKEIGIKDKYEKMGIGRQNIIMNLMCVCVYADDLLKCIKFLKFVKFFTVIVMIK